MAACSSFLINRLVDLRPYLRDTHKPEAILLSLTPLVFERFLPISTLWLSPNCRVQTVVQLGSCDGFEVPSKLVQALLRPEKAGTLFFNSLEWR